MATVTPRAYDWAFCWKIVLAFTSAEFRLDCAARSLADFVTPRKVGMAMASRMARISRTTMSSMRVNPASSPARCRLSSESAAARRLELESRDFGKHRSWQAQRFVGSAIDPPTSLRRETAGMVIMKTSSAGLFLT